MLITWCWSNAWTKFNLIHTRQKFKIICSCSCKKIKMKRLKNGTNHEKYFKTIFPKWKNGSVYFINLFLGNEELLSSTYLKTRKWRTTVINSSYLQKLMTSISLEVPVYNSCVAVYYSAHSKFAHRHGIVIKFELSEVW